MLTGRPFVIRQIRAGRKKPGLARQHLTAVKAAAKICNAKVRCADLGSKSFEFQPGETTGGEYEFDIGTAGSVTLVLQTVLPALLTAPQPTRLSLTGGTHNPSAPPVDYLEHCFLPLVNRLGARVSVSLERHGFYPTGGGRMIARIEPAERLTPFDLLERGELLGRRLVARSARLPSHVVEREVETMARELYWSRERAGEAPAATDASEKTHPPSSSRCETELDTSIDAACPGNYCFAQLSYSEVVELTTGFGERGVRAEFVAQDAARAMRRYVLDAAPVGEHLADQWLLPLALAVFKSGIAGSFRCQSLSSHAETQLQVLRAFSFPGSIHVSKENESPTHFVRLEPT